MKEECLYASTTKIKSIDISQPGEMHCVITAAELRCYKADPGHGMKIDELFNFFIYKEEGSSSVLVVEDLAIFSSSIYQCVESGRSLMSILKLFY
ncbi:uncharacterized protein PRCAT00004080001 [Priceomyces carsonii]|uniref:uncharacterized protein n=1 Tax=Priceomyces carsonii TaxID=28549 RepID=UPI002ED7DD84|nr:unnamed protein product [Priceomyces carsonii]